MFPSTNSELSGSSGFFNVVYVSISYKILGIHAPFSPLGVLTACTTCLFLVKSSCNKYPSSLSYDHARSLLAFDERLRSPILASYQRCMAGTQCSRASVLIPLFAVYGLVHAVDAVFPVDSFFPDHQHQNLRAAKHPTHALHTGVVVHHPFDGLLVYPAVAPLHPDGVRRSPLSLRQQPDTSMCAVSGSAAALHCHAAVSYIRLKSFQHMIPSIVPHIPES